MYLTSILTFLFGVIFVFQLGNRFESSVVFQKVWGWSKTADLGMKESTFATNPFQLLNGYARDNQMYFFSSGQVEKKNGMIYEIPLFGKGFFEYEQAGTEVSFYSSWKEILWKKEINSYPKAGPNGEMVLFTSGDNNQIIITDGSGNQLANVSGRFLTDYSISQNQDTLIVFSGGEVYTLDKTGKTIVRMDLHSENENEILFIKSAVISPGGSCIALHYLEGNADFIAIYKKKDKEYDIQLSRIYPHHIAMAISDSCELAVNLNDKTIIADNGGKILVDVEKKVPESIYQPILAFGNYFILSRGNSLFIYDLEGNILQEEKMSDLPWRASAVNEKEFFIETGKEFFQYKKM